MFYVYVYLDPLYAIESQYGYLRFNYLPIYIGKGKGQRYTAHLKQTNNPIFRNKIKCWKRKGINPIIVKLHEGLTEQEAWDWEKTYILMIGRLDQGKGTLLNLTDGGEGPGGRIPWNKGKSTGWIASPDARARISAANKGKVVSAETKAKISAGLRGKLKSEEHRSKLSAANKGKSHHPYKGKKNVYSQEQRDKWSESHKKSWTLERRAETSKRMKGRKFSEQAKHKSKETRAANGYTHSSETRRIMSEKRKQYWDNKKQNGIDK